jgi:phosphate/sulfate permease
MDSFIAWLVDVGVPTAIVGGIIALVFSRIEKRLDEKHTEREKKEEEREKSRKEYEYHTMKQLMAVTALSEANAIALQNGKCNGETHRALEYTRQIKHEQREFFTRLGIDHLY